MFGIEKLDDVPKTLARVYSERLASGTVPLGLAVRGPVGLFLVREDGGFGSELAKEVVGSYEYWHDRSRYFFDGVFLGWGYDDGSVCFMPDKFTQCVDDLEAVLTWKETRGSAYLLLTDFVYDPTTGTGFLDFSRTMPLDITQLLKKEKYPQLSALIGELVEPMRRVRGERASVSVNEISDYVGLLNARRSAWQALVEKIGPLLGIVDALAPFGVKDMRRVKSPRGPAASVM